MSTPVKDGKLLYHLTSIDNLEGIFKNGLLPRSNLNKNFDDIANQDIIDKRNEFKINDYVPFHLFCKNPFDGAVQKKYKNKSFVYITVRRSLALKLDAKVLPKHPLAMNSLVIYNYKEGMNKINWDLLEERNFLDEDCKQTCLCEVIFPCKILSNNIFSIATKTNKDTEFVKNLADTTFERRSSFYIETKNEWFI